MKTLFLKIGIVMGALVVGFELCFGLVLPRLLDNVHDSYLDRWSSFYGSSNRNTELICLGSSRVHRHCNPEIISERTGMATEIVASAGARLPVYKALYRDYVKRNGRPEILVVGVDLSGLDSNIVLPDPHFFIPRQRYSDETSKLPQFDYIRHHKALGYFYYKDAYYHILESPDKVPHVNGFAPRNIPWDNKMNDLIESKNGITFTVSDETVERIMQFIKNEEKAGVKCVAVIAPEYYEIWPYQKNRRDVLDKIKSMSERYHVRLVNFSDSSYKPCFNKDLFYNSQHLNGKGADVFSRDLSDTLKKVFALAGRV